jgi:hypothetical protein
MYDQRNIRTLAFAAVKSNFVEARRTLFSELFDMCWCAKATAVSRPPLSSELWAEIRPAEKRSVDVEARLVTVHYSFNNFVGLVQ